MGLIDLQTHTTASDGTLSPAALVRAARGAGVDVLAITDHDTLDGLEEAVRAGGEVGVRVVAGVELSVVYERRGVHLLGLFCDPDNRRLRTTLSELRAGRERRAERMVGKLRSLGYSITMQDVLAQAGAASLARPHVARALVAKGYAPDVPSAFTRELIGDGGRADVRHRTLHAAEAIRLLAETGALPVLAHPARTRVPFPHIVRLADVGLAGVEVDHPDHTPEQRSRLRRLAREIGLVPTGGSDFHTPDGPALGSCPTAPDEFAALEELVLQR